MTAAEALRAGQAVILPTDTVYGLCALPGNEDVLYELKGRDRSKPIALVAADVDSLVAAVPGLDRAVLERFLPGPYTLVLATPDGGRSACVCRTSRRPRRTCSRRPGRCWQRARTSQAARCSPRRGHSESIRAAVGAIVDAGELPGVPSTVLDFTGTEPRVLRQGAGKYDP